MISETIYEAGKKILSEVLHFESPSVVNPTLEEISGGYRMSAGNAILHVYDISIPENLRQWRKDADAAKNIGSINGHFITDNVYLLDHRPLGWYLTAKTAWQN